ncbi:MAG: molybdopterin-dependent oxidoreductase [Pseudomonadales bacterium]
MSEKRTVHTYCRICEPTCALLAEVDEAQNVRLRPDKSHPVHQGFACHKGLNFTEIHTDPDRLNHPLARRGARSGPAAFEQLDWDSVATQIADRVRAVQATWGDDAFAMYNGNPGAFNASAREGVRRFAGLIGARYFFGSGTQDCTNKFAASERVFGTANLHPIPDFKHTRYFLSIGSNPRISHMSFVHTTDPMGKLRDIVRRGGKVVHINPRRIESATPATGDVVLIKPDTDLYFLAALIHEMVANRWHDDAFLRAHGRNVDAMLDFVARYPATRVAGITGIDADTIRTIAHEFASAEGASVHMSTGVNMGRQGTLAYWLVQMLSLASGNLGQRGGNLYSPGYFPAATVGKPGSDDPFFDSEFGSLRTITGSLPGNLLADYIEAGKVKALVCTSGNPLLSMGGESRLRRAFEKLELLIVVDIYPNATSEYADFVLPATDWLEREDINAISVGFHPEPYVQYTPAVVAPLADRRPEWWIFGKLAAALGDASIADSKTFNPLSRADRQLGIHGLSLQTLKDTPGHVVRLPDPEPEQLFSLGVQHGEQRVDCCPALFTPDLDTAERLFEELAAEPEDTLKLISLRTNYMVNSWFHNVPSLKRDNALDNPLHMNPDDAAARQLAEGTEVRVSNRYGAVVATVRLDDTLRRGVVAMTHGWGHGGNRRLRVASNHPGVNVNELLPTGIGSYERLSNQSHMTGIAVDVAAVA